MIKLSVVLQLAPSYSLSQLAPASDRAKQEGKHAVCRVAVGDELLSFLDGAELSAASQLASSYSFSGGMLRRTLRRWRPALVAPGAVCASLAARFESDALLVRPERPWPQRGHSTMGTKAYEDIAR